MSATSIIELGEEVERKERLRRPSKSDRDAILDDFMKRQRVLTEEQSAAIAQAVPALQRLVKTCKEHICSGQVLKLRELLYSAWNGQATSLLEIVALDWALKQDLMKVLLAFGCEPRDESFYYDAISDAWRSVGLYDWFLSAHRPEEEDS